MKINLQYYLSGLLLLTMLNTSSGQAPPLGLTSSFALFTAVGAFSNDGTSAVTGDIGTNVGAFSGFPPGIVIGQIHVADDISAQAAADVDVAYSFMGGITCGEVIGTTMGDGQVLGPNVYCLGAASTINGDLLLDGQCNPDALFIFKIDGALSTTVFSRVILINSASLCNVWWQVNGAVSLGENSVFRGNILANGAISLLEASSLFGRGLSRAGAIALHNNVVNMDMQPSASLIFANGPTTLCNGETVMLSGNCGGTWSNGETTATITVSAGGDYFVTNSNGCGSATSNVINVTTCTICSLTVNAGADVFKCHGKSIQLSATSDDPTAIYSWSPTEGLDDPNIANPTTSVTHTTTYTVTATAANGCTATDEVTVTVYDLVKAKIKIKSNTASCAAPCVKLATHSNDNYVYTWRYNNADASVGNIHSNTYCACESGTYSVYVTDTSSGCMHHSKKIEIIIAPKMQNADQITTDHEIQINAWPNPANDNLNVSIQNAREGVVTVQLLDMLGRVLQVVHLNGDDISTNETISFNLEQLLAGMYFVRIINGDFNAEQKVIKN
ncbi:MAG: ice-binding family protein [Chitinophagales bacterium]